MATSSRYVQLSSSVLMEYVYSDQSQINEVGNPYRISTTTAPIWKMSNTHNNQDQILNADSSETVQDGLPIGTGNVRNRSFAIVEPFKSALLDIDKLVFYNDYDPALTSTVNLPITFTNTQAPVYDTVKLHLVQGFNFEENQALILSIKAKKKDGTNFILGNLVYKKDDTFETMNPSSFFFGGRVYNSYLEIRILSLYNLIYDYWIGTLTGDTVVERITDFNGVKRDQQIQIFFSWVNDIKTIENQDYLTLIGTKSVDLPVRDQFETIGAYIAESTGGDYIEFYATYADSIIENYMIDLRSTSGDYILLHDLVISEYVYNYDGSSGSYNWIKTDDLQIAQYDEWGTPNVYRPVIRNSNAISFKIDYTVRLYNRDDNNQVWKSASLISQSASKYGRILRSINLGANPVQTKIYNQKVVKDISINRVSDPVVNNVKFITSLSNNSNISITTESINEMPGATGSSSIVNSTTTLQKSSSGTSNLQVYDNGLAKVLIPESTAFLKFTIFQKVNKQNSAMNLSGLGNMYLIFKSPTGDNIEISEYPNTYTSKGLGEVVFKLSEKQAKQVLALTDRTFQIFLQNDSGDRTFLYSGKFYSTTEFQSISETDRVSKLETQIKTLNTQILDLTNLVRIQQDKITNISTENSQFKNLINSIKGATSTAGSTTGLEIDTAESNTTKALKSQVSDLQNQIDVMMTSIQNSVNSLSQANGLPVVDFNEEIKNNINQGGGTSKTLQSKSDKDLKIAKANMKTINASNMQIE